MSFSGKHEAERKRTKPPRCNGERGGDRTHDHMIKSHVLYH
jgi:hypothetical protein